MGGRGRQEREREVAVGEKACGGEVCEEEGGIE